jgi:hypothetical protein
MAVGHITLLLLGYGDGEPDHAKQGTVGKGIICQRDLNGYFYCGIAS